MTIRDIHLAHMPHSISVRTMISQTLNAVSNAFTVYQERKALSELSLSAMDDIGLDPVSAQKEATRSVWDLPKGRFL